MTRQIAVDYIKNTRAQGFSDAALRRELEKSGWPASEIDLAFIESRATDQKPAIEPPPTQFVPRTQPQWEEKSAETFNTEPKPVDLTKTSFVRPQDIPQKPAEPSSFGVPTGTIDNVQFTPPPKTAPAEQKPTEPVALRISAVQKSTITPANELSEPVHPKELPRTGTPDTAPSISLDTKISEVKKTSPEPLIMGVKESELIKPMPRPEQPKPPVVEIKKTEPLPAPVSISEFKQPVAQPVVQEQTALPRFKPMQEEVVADLVGNGLAASGAGQSTITRSPVLESIGVPPRVRSRRTLTGVLVAVLFFIASGAAAGFWYYENTIKPQSIVKGALVKAQNMKSYKYDAQLQIKARETNATLGKAARSFVPPLASFALGAMTAGKDTAHTGANYTFTMRVKGAIDAHDATKPKSETTFTVGTKDLVAPGMPNANTEFESKFVDGVYYFQVSKMPFFDSAMVDSTIPRFTSADITGRWVSINFETFERDFNNYAKELSELEPSFVGYHLDLTDQQDLITEKQTKDIEKLWGETRLIVWSDEIVREEENGTDRYRVKGTLDKDSFKRFVIQSAEITGGIGGAGDKEVVDELFSELGDIEINAWIDKASGNLVRFSIKAGSSFAEGNGKQGVLEFHLTTDLSDIDSPITIAPPTEHYDVRNLLEKLFAYAREGFASDSADARDARRLSDLSRLRAALDLYKKREGTYPVKLSDLISEYMATIPSDPLTKKQYRYTRTTKSYVLSAELENKKNPILKQDANPSNTLYDIGPAL
jgi:hypothetical protein